MGRPLLVLGIAGIAAAVLAALVLIPPANLLVPLFAIVCAVVLFTRRTSDAAAAGGVVLLLAVLAVMGTVSSINIRGNDVAFPISPSWGDALVILCALAVVGAVMAVLRDGFTRVMAIVGGAALALSALLAILWRHHLADHAAGRTAFVALLALVAIVPLLGLWKSDASIANASGRKPSRTRRSNTPPR